VRLDGVDASGTGVVMVAMPGRYEPFSITVRSEQPILKIQRVWVSLNENSGTTSAIY